MEVLDLSLSDVCNAYNLPVGLFNNNDSSTFSNQEQYRKQAYTDSILPTLSKFEYSFNHLFMNDEGFISSLTLVRFLNFRPTVRSKFLLKWCVLMTRTRKGR